MKGRAPYQLDVFDFETWEAWGYLRDVDTLVGAQLQFIGWDESGEVVFDTDNPTGVAAVVVVTDYTQKLYAAVAGPLPAVVTPTPANKTYSWQVRRTNAGQEATLVWGFTTVTPSNVPNTE